MKKKAFYTSLLMGVATMASAQTFDADGNRIDSELPRAPPNSALYEMQKRNAGVMNNLKRQTPEYQEGHAAAVENMREREAYRARQRESGSADAKRESRTRFSLEDEAKIENLNKDMHKRYASPADKRATSEELNRIYSKYGANPLQLAPPPPPQPKPTTTFGSRTIQTPNGMVYCNSFTRGNRTTETCH
ncbi:MAG: hypothetical protein JNJ76_00065 [Candidatus Competibacter sp.]|nr:hypothetical protein [Candidatus Competibacter sp.]